MLSMSPAHVSGRIVFFFFFQYVAETFFFSEDFYSMLTLRDFLAHRSKQTYGKKMNPIRPLDRTLLVAPTPSPMRPRPAVSSEGPLFRSSHTVCIYTWFNNILPPFFYICRSWFFKKNFNTSSYSKKLCKCTKTYGILKLPLMINHVTTK